MKFSYRLKKTLLRAAALFCAVSTAVAMTACSDKGETSTVQLSPKETVEKIFTLAKSKDYDSLAEYCRSFSKMSMELYFTDTGTDYDAKWLSRYSATLASIFDNYVTYDNLTEKADKETRTGSVTGTFTALDMEKFNEKTDSKINSEFKNDYNAQMDYIDSVIGDKEFKSKEFEYTINGHARTSIKRGFDYYLSIESLTKNANGDRAFVRIGVTEYYSFMKAIMDVMDWFTNAP